LVRGGNQDCCFDELDIHQFVQFAISIIEREEDLPTVRPMLAQLRATM
jgi:hypothetical protein